MEELKRTPLYDMYRQMGAKLIDFGGWALPVQFSSIKAEHEAVRMRAGLFDVSHMGEIEVKGPDAFSFLQTMLTNDLAKLKPGKAQYTFLCNEAGGTVDDLLVYQFHDDSYLLVVNAANTEKDFQWLSTHRTGQVNVTNVSANYAQLALQGPLAENVLQKLSDDDLSAIPVFGFKQYIKINGATALVSRPDIRERMVLRFIVTRPMPGGYGRRFWQPEKMKEFYHAAWEPGTHCVLKLACHCTGKSYLPPFHRLKRD